MSSAKLVPSSTIAGTAADLDEAAAVFADVRAKLHTAAARVLHNREEAHDIVQEAWLRWQSCDRARVRNPTAFLVTTTIRLAINSLQSARSRREICVGDWTSEAADTDEDPTVGPERDAALEQCCRTLLERLSPIERAAFVLRHALDYPYPRIAAILQHSEANTRQIVNRAGKRVRAEGHRMVSPSDQRRLVTAFAAAARRGDVAELELFFAAEREQCSSWIRSRRRPVR